MLPDETWDDKSRLGYALGLMHGAMLRARDLLHTGYALEAEAVLSDTLKCVQSVLWPEKQPGAEKKPK